jgi:hypothetical protein
MRPYEPAPAGKIKRGIAFEQTSPPVLVELERPRDAGPRSAKSIRAGCAVIFPSNRGALSRADEVSVSDDFRKTPAAGPPVGNAPHSHFFQRKNR